MSPYYPAHPPADKDGVEHVGGRQPCNMGGCGHMLLWLVQGWRYYGTFGVGVQPASTSGMGDVVIHQGLPPSSLRVFSNVDMASLYCGGDGC